MKDQESGGVYPTAEDTLLLIDAIKRCVGERLLEIGVGSGLILSKLAERDRLTVGADIDPAALRAAKRSLSLSALRGGAELVCCDSATPFRESVFDLVVFNPPYLPSEDVRDVAIDGGHGGIEVSKAWFREASRCLGKAGRIVFVASSLSDMEELFDYVRGLGFEIEVLNRAPLFFEDLSVIEARRR